MVRKEKLESSNFLKRRPLPVLMKSTRNNLKVARGLMGFKNQEHYLVIVLLKAAAAATRSCRRRRSFGGRGWRSRFSLGLGHGGGEGLVLLAVDLKLELVAVRHFARKARIQAWKIKMAAEMDLRLLSVVAVFIFLIFKELVRVVSGTKITN